MLYSKQLTNELTQLINQKNQSSFVNGDLTFDFLARQPNGDMTVSVTASPGVAYYGEQELTYTRRSLTNALKGVPVKLVVGGSADMRELLGMFATKYGFEFDTAVDFLQSELDKTIDFSESGLVAVTLPAADTSNIWIGELSITVSNDALDLDAIIKVAQMTSFAYLQEDAAKGSLDLATWPIRHVHPELPMKKGVNYISQSLVQALLENMVADGNVKQEDADAIYAAMAFTGNNNTVMFNVMEDTSVTPSMFFSYLFSATMEPFNTPNFAGLPWVWYENTDATEQIQYVLRNQGASTVTLKLTGWNDIKVGWGDGSQLETEGTTFTHTFADDKEYIIVATGTPDPLLSYSKQSIRGFDIIQIDAWNNGLKYSPETNNLQRLTKVPSSLPTTWIALDNLFAYASTFNGPEVLSWNTSNISSMAGMFNGASKFNQPIEIWDVSNVTDMNFMFNSAIAFNQPLNQWNVGNVRNFSFALSSAFAFNQPLDKWDVSKATNFGSMFSGTKVFNSDISGWDVSKVTSMTNMFNNTVFNQDIGAWQTTSLKQIDYLMKNNKVFNQDLSGWDVSAITSGLSTVGDGATAWAAEYKPGYVAVSKFLKAVVQPGELKISVTKPTDYSSAPWYRLSTTGIKVNFTDGIIQTITVSAAGTIEVGWDEMVSDVRVSVGGAALTEVSQFDTVGNVTQYDFQRSPNLVKVPTSLPATVLRTSSMFYYCSSFNGAEVVGWDVSHVTSMGQMFQNATTFNQDLSGWNTDAVTNNTWFADGATAWEVAKQPTFANAS